MAGVLITLMLHAAASLLPVSGLRLTELVGQKYPDRGEHVRLTCNFDTEGATLYSVKWYKDENEFFRYMPDDRPHIQKFPVIGVNLDDSGSGMNHVMLSDVSFLSSGSYRCEVSTEAPSFDTVFSSHNMTVLSYPRGGPVLTGAQEVVNVGDVVSVNCTAPPSYPAPKIYFYTNVDKVQEWLVHNGALEAHEDGTFSRFAVLTFRTEVQHFVPPEDVLELKCEVDVSPLPANYIVAYIYLNSGRFANQKLAQQNYRNYGATTEFSATLLVYVLFLCLL